LRVRQGFFVLWPRNNNLISAKMLTEREMKTDKLLKGPLDTDMHVNHSGVWFANFCQEIISLHLCTWPVWTKCCPVLGFYKNHLGLEVFFKKMEDPPILGLENLGLDQIFITNDPRFHKSNLYNPWLHCWCAFCTLWLDIWCGNFVIGFF
jgi:hypothetical protein